MQFVSLNRKTHAGVSLLLGPGWWLHDKDIEQSSLQKKPKRTPRNELPLELSDDEVLLLAIGFFPKSVSE
jgi:hypothetical protein